MECQCLLESGLPLHLHSGCGSDCIVLNSPCLCSHIPSTDFLKLYRDRVPKFFMFPNSWGIAYTPPSPPLSWDCSSVSESLHSTLFRSYTPFPRKTLATIDFYFYCYGFYFLEYCLQFKSHNCSHFRLYSITWQPTFISPAQLPPQVHYDLTLF